MADGPVAIVTAAGRGIGAACARELAARGYRLALMSPSDRSLMLASELGGVGMRGSVASPDDLERLVQGALGAYGRIDAVVANTGDPERADLLSLTDSQWLAAMDLVFLNVVRLARLVTPVMLSKGGGAWVNISAADAYEPDLRFPMGSTLRAALGAWSKLYADRYGPQGIRMNCLLPGVVLAQDSDSQWDDLRSKVPLRRAGRYEEIAKAAAFLLSPDAAYITGQNIRVDGGLTRSV